MNSPHKHTKLGKASVKKLSETLEHMPKSRKKEVVSIKQMMKHENEGREREPEDGKRLLPREVVKEKNCMMNVEKNVF